MLLTAVAQPGLGRSGRSSGPARRRPARYEQEQKVSLKKLSVVVAGAAAAGAVLLGGAALADAATNTFASSSTPSAYGPGQPGATNDTPVTGEELAKVTAAVRAKDSAVTVTS